jgi:hypothetical protein
MSANKYRFRAFHWWMAVGLVLTMASATSAQSNATPPPPPATTAPALTLPAVKLPATTLLPATTPAATAPAAQARASMEIYGFAMLDRQNFKTINLNWFDTMRVTKLPSFEGQTAKTTARSPVFARAGVRATMPTALGDLKTQFEFELFGTGVDSGQTTFRLRHAYGEL